MAPPGLTSSPSIIPLELQHPGRREVLRVGSFLQLPRTDFPLAKPQTGGDLTLPPVSAAWGQVFHDVKRSVHPAEDMTPEP